MPVCLDNELSQKKEKHLQVQRKVVERLRQRFAELESIDNKTDKELAAHKKLRMYLNGEVEDPNNPGSFIKQKNTAEERLALIEAIYNRPSYHFQHKYKDGDNDKERYSDIFGLPSLNELYEKNPALAFDMIARTLSLVQSGDSTRNPYDYLDTENNEVKIGKYGSTEHHHIYNNVALNEDGRIQVQSVTFNRDESGNLSLRVIPAYHGSTYEKATDKVDNMNAVQYIALQSELHSGNDPVTHLHYYKFDENESNKVLDIAKAKLKEEQSKLPKKIENLTNEISKYQKRLDDPVAYEKDLIKLKENILSDNQDLDKQVIKPDRLRDIKSKFIKDFGSQLSEEERLSMSSGQKSILTQEQLNTIKKYGQPDTVNKLTQHYEKFPIKQQLDQLGKDLAKHQSDMESGNEIKKISRQIEGIAKKQVQVKEKAGVTERTIKDWVRSYLRGKELPKEKLKIAKQYLQLDTLRQSKFLDRVNIENKLSVLQLLQKKKEQLRESEEIANLDDSKIEEMFNRENGYFSFDKGFQEKTQHSKLTNVMNREITYNLARQALQFLEEKGISTDDIIKQQFSSNLKSTISYAVDILNRQKEEQESE